MRRWRPAWLRPGPSRLLGHRLRCLTPGQELSSAELRYFTDVDHHDPEALGTLNHRGGRGVGVARYIRDADDPQGARLAPNWWLSYASSQVSPSARRR